MTLAVTKIGQNYFERDSSQGVYPIFSYELNRRVKNKEACVVVIVGEAGTGKSYMAIQLSRNIDKRFSAEQIIFTYADYVKELGRLRAHGIPIVFDEPSYAMGKREWYKEINQALVKTIESQRFLVRPLLIPIINVNLLDKTLRDYLVIFQVHITRRGSARVFRMQASQGEDKTYRHLVCRLQYPPLDFDLCQENSCLGCEKLNDCPTLRAQYERKKATIQLSRYEQDEQQARMKDSKELTMDQLCSMITPFESDYLENGIVNVRLLRLAYRDKLGMKVGHNKSYDIKSQLESRRKSIPVTT